MSKDPFDILTEKDLSKIRAVVGKNFRVDDKDLPQFVTILKHLKGGWDRIEHEFTLGKHNGHYYAAVTEPSASWIETTNELYIPITDWSYDGVRFGKWKLFDWDRFAEYYRDTNEYLNFFDFFI